MDKQRLNISSNNPLLPPLITENNLNIEPPPTDQKSAGVMSLSQKPVSSAPVPMNPECDLTIPTHLMKQPPMTCPECHISLVRFGLCFSCPLCGLGSCG